jgi:hypothetical protein
VKSASGKRQAARRACAASTHKQVREAGVECRHGQPALVQLSHGLHTRCSSSRRLRHLYTQICTADAARRCGKQVWEGSITQRQAADVRCISCYMHNAA